MMPFTNLIAMLMSIRAIPDELPKRTCMRVTSAIDVVISIREHPRLLQRRRGVLYCGVVGEYEHTGRHEKVENPAGLVNVDFTHFSAVSIDRVDQAHLASRRLSRPCRRSFSVMYICLMARYGLGITRILEHSICSSSDNRSSDAELARLSGIATSSALPLDRFDALPGRPFGAIRGVCSRLSPLPVGGVPTTPCKKRC